MIQFEITSTFSQISLLDWGRLIELLLLQLLSNCLFWLADHGASAAAGPDLFASEIAAFADQGPLSSIFLVMSDCLHEDLCKRVEMVIADPEYRATVTLPSISAYGWSQTFSTSWGTGLRNDNLEFRGDKVVGHVVSELVAKWSRWMTPAKASVRFLSRFIASTRSD